MLRRLQVGAAAMVVTVGSLAVGMLPGPAEARSQTCHTVDYGGYTDTPCYLASLNQPAGSAPNVDCVVNDNTAGNYKVAIVFHYEDGQWVPVNANASDSVTWLETSYDVNGGSMGEYLCWGGIYASTGGPLLDAAVQYPS